MYVTERATQARREIAHNAKQKGRSGGAGRRRERPLQKKRRECIRTGQPKKTASRIRLADYFLAVRGGIEPTTHCLEGSCSIH